MDDAERFRWMYRMLLAGLCFTTIHIKIDGFDVLIDPVGYALIAAGTLGLAQWARQFAVACILSLLLIPVSATRIVLGLTHGDSIGWFGALGNIALLWVLLGAIISLANSVQNHQLSQRAYSRRVVYVSLVLVALGLQVLAPILGLELISGMLSVTAFIALLFVLHVLWQARVLGDALHASSRLPA